MHPFSHWHWLVRVCLLALPLYAMSFRDAAADDRGLVVRKRHAFVIGNGNYQTGPVLRNASNDARDVYHKLLQLGFTDSILLTDATHESMQTKLGEFTRRLKPGADALFFYAGHGMMVGGTNYLIPVGANLASENDVKSEAMALDDILDAMESAHARVRIVILDACRDNPFTRRWTRSSRGWNVRGWGSMQSMGRTAASGVKIMYATQPGQTASDGIGANGEFTSALLKWMATPDVSVNDLFEFVAQDVINATGGNQIPWQEGLLLGAFYFNPSQASGGTAMPGRDDSRRETGPNPVEGLLQTMGDEGYLMLDGMEANLASMGGRFRIYRDHYVIDTRLPLLWSRCAYGQAYLNDKCTGQATAMNYQQAVQVTDELNSRKTHGISTWRLPTADELASLHANKSVPPDIDETYFPNTNTSLHLTSTTYSSDKLALVQFGYGSSVEHIKPIEYRAVLRLVSPYRVAK